MKNTILFSIIGVHAFLFCDDAARVATLEDQMSKISTKTPRGNLGPKLQNASFNLDSFGFYTSVDIVTYQLLENNNAYAYGTSINSNGAHASYKTDFAWDVGFKAAFGYYTAHDFWQTGLSFTYFQTQKKSTALPSSENQYVFISDNVMQNGYYQTNYDMASDSFKVSFYNLDWTLGRDFFISKYLSLFPNIGVKTAWFYQDRKTHFKKYKFNSDLSDLKTGAYFQDTYVGVGPKVDTTFKFHLGKNYSLFAKVDAALLWSTNKTLYNGYSIDQAHHVITFNNSEIPGQINPYVGTNLGFCYDSNYLSDNFNFSILLSYEQQYYASASRLFINDVPSFENIALRGVDLSFLFQF